MQRAINDYADAFAAGQETRNYMKLARKELRETIRQIHISRLPQVSKVCARQRLLQIELRLDEVKGLRASWDCMISKNEHRRGFWDGYYSTDRQEAAA